MTMNFPLPKSKIPLLSLVLGSLIIASLSSGKANASWNFAKCKIQCRSSTCARDEKKLNDCATNCDNSSIMSCVLPNCSKLNPANQKHLEAFLKFKQTAKERQQGQIEEQLRAAIDKKKSNTPEIKSLSQKQDKLVEEINALGVQIEKCIAPSASPMPQEQNKGAMTRKSAILQRSNEKLPVIENSHANLTDVPPALPEREASEEKKTLQEQIINKRSTLRKSNNQYTLSEEEKGEEKSQAEEKPPIAGPALPIREDKTDNVPPPPPGVPPLMNGINLPGNPTQAQPNRKNLLAEIQQGKDLRQGKPSTVKPKEEGGVTTAIAQAMAKRRVYLDDSSDKANSDESWDD